MKNPPAASCALAATEEDDTTTGRPRSVLHQIRAQQSGGRPRSPTTTEATTHPSLTTLSFSRSRRGFSRPYRGHRDALEVSGRRYGSHRVDASNRSPRRRITGPRAFLEPIRRQARARPASRGSQRFAKRQEKGRSGRGEGEWSAHGPLALPLTEAFRPTRPIRMNA
ncbi:hypothetical protein HPB50_010934 [Hyalomma asiaticum]|uniref:Uncharacterized protein n=1 Tax=Hyalomma asiaticum TaxID=266040 RepID=A0ACB7TG06_HYAAI|nr:hypothetical protein HPB50_010934 [Hyalomma asiaticum]